MQPVARRRILHVYDKLSTDGSTIHGGARLLMWTLPRLGLHGFDVSLACLRAADQAGRYLEVAGVTLHYLGRSRFDPRTVTDLLRLIRELGVDVLHTHGYTSTDLGRIAGRIADIPVVVHEHFVDDAIPLYQRLADRLLAPWTTVGIAVSRAVAGFMATRRHVPADRLLVLSGGVPTDQFRRVPETVSSTLRAGLGIAATAPVVGCVGRLAEVKGHKFLLRAWPEVLAAFPAAVLLLVGDGPERAALERLARELGIGSSVVFAGHRDDISSLLSLLDVFALPSLSEGLGIALIEAMALKVPVVASDVGGIAELLSHERDGLLVPAQDSRALAAGVIRLLTQRDFAGQLAGAAAQTATLLDIVLYAAALATLYRALCSEPAASARRRNWRGFSWIMGWTKPPGTVQEQCGTMQDTV